jgi:hypothetical protein
MSYHRGGAPCQGILQSLSIFHCLLQASEKQYRGGRDDYLLDQLENDSAADGEGGHIPMWLYVKTIGITSAKAIMSMKRALMQEQDDRNANKIQE